MTPSAVPEARAAPVDNANFWVLKGAAEEGRGGSWAMQQRLAVTPVTFEIQNSALLHWVSHGVREMGHIREAHAGHVLFKMEWRRQGGSKACVDGVGGYCVH
jgi:hypothetical protein